VPVESDAGQRAVRVFVFRNASKVVNSRAEDVWQTSRASEGERGGMHRWTRSQDLICLPGWSNTIYAINFPSLSGIAIDSAKSQKRTLSTRGG